MQEFIKKFASDAALVVDSCIDVINRQAAEIEKLKGMRQEASAEVKEVIKEVVKEVKIELDETKLNKAASALHTMHGNPSTCTPEQIAQYWKSNPDSMLGLIEKMASATIEKATNTEAEFGKVVEKKASADVVVTPAKDAAAAAFWGN